MKKRGDKVTIEAGKLAGKTVTVKQKNFDGTYTVNYQGTRYKLPVELVEETTGSPVEKVEKTEKAEVEKKKVVIKDSAEGETYKTSMLGVTHPFISSHIPVEETPVDDVDDTESN